MPFSKVLKRAVLKLAARVPTTGFFECVRSPLEWVLPRAWLGRIPVVGTVSVALPNGRRVLLSTDGRDSIATSLFWNGLAGFEPETIDLMVKLLDGPRTVFDVGANTGVFSLIAAAMHPRNRVYAFEPLEEIFTYLSRNARLNGFTNLVSERLAVGDRCGASELYVPATACLSTAASTSAGFRPAERVVQVPAVSLDEYVYTHGIAGVDLIKIDTETTEHLVLRGALDTIDRDHPLIICEVLYGCIEKLLTPIFASRTYRMFLISAGGLLPLDTLVGDPTFRNRNMLFAHVSDLARIEPWILPLTDHQRRTMSARPAGGPE